MLMGVTVVNLPTVCEPKDLSDMGVLDCNTRVFASLKITKNLKIFFITTN